MKRLLFLGFPLLFACSGAETEVHLDIESRVKAATEALTSGEGADTVIPQTSDLAFHLGDIFEIGGQKLRHGFATDWVLAFLAETGAPPGVLESFRVPVYSMYTRQELGELPPPDRGWISPFTVKLKPATLEYSYHWWDFFHLFPKGVSGEVIVFDSLIPTAIGQGHLPLLVTYEYSYDPSSGFQATKLSECGMPMDDPTTPPPAVEGMTYPTGFDILPDGRIMVADTIAGVIWVAEAGCTGWRPGLLPGPEFNVKLWPQDVTVDDDDDPATPEVPGVRATFPVNGPDTGWNGQQDEFLYRTVAIPTPMGLATLLPGVHSVSYVPERHSVVYSAIAPTPPIGEVDVDVLYDPTTPPDQKVTSQLVPPIPGVTDFVGLIWNQGDWIYFLRALGNSTWPGLHEYGYGPPRYYRVHKVTGELEWLIADALKLDIPSHHYPLPPHPSGWLDGFTCGVAINVHQGKLPEANGFLQGDPLDPTDDDYSLFPNRYKFPAYCFGK